MTKPNTHDHHPTQHPDQAPLGPHPMGPEEPAGVTDDDGPPSAKRPTDFGDDEDTELGVPPAPV